MKEGRNYTRNRIAAAAKKIGNKYVSALFFSFDRRGPSTQFSRRPTKMEPYVHIGVLSYSWAYAVKGLRPLCLGPKSVINSHVLIAHQAEGFGDGRDAPAAVCGGTRSRPAYLGAIGRGEHRRLQRGETQKPTRHRRGAHTEHFGRTAI